MTRQTSGGRRKPRKHSVFPKICVILFIVSLVVFWWYETFALTVTRQTIASEKIHDEVTFVLLSDLHGAQFGPDNASLLALIQQQEPDWIAVVGDLYTYGDENGKEIALSFMEQLTDVAPVYFVNGDHDFGVEFASELEAAGVNALRYEDELLEFGNTRIHLYGITNVYYTSTFNLSNAFGQDGENYRILLSHIPNFDKFARFGMDLSLCGDTHGGQIRLPMLGAVYLPDEGFFPELHGAYVKGLYRRGTCLMYITGGLGTNPIPIRLFDRPEIVVITLTPDRQFQ